MKNLILIFSLLLPVWASAQGTVSWYKIAGGGGTSAGGGYQISGTIGQHDAGGPMTGGSYSLTGGFWGVLISLVQTPGMPTLSIRSVGPDSAVVSWLNTGSYTLQTNSSVTGAWVNYGGTINMSGGTNSVTITPPTGDLFFRLSNP